MFFDGNFKNRRPINLGGINTTYNPTSVAKKDLLKHTEEERIKRELLRRKLEAAIRIQAFFRSKMCIRQWAIQERKTWDQTIQHHESLYLTLLPTDVFISLCRALVFFFKTSEDSDRLIKLIEFSDSNSLPSQLLTHPALFRKLVLHIFWSLNNVSVPKNETQISFLLSLAQHHPSLLHSSEFIFPFEQYLRLLLSKGSCSNESTSLDTKHPPLLPKSLPSLLILIASMHPQSFLRRIVPLPGLMDVFSPTYLKFLRNNFPLLSLLKASEVVYPTSSFSKDFSVTVFLNNFIALSSHQLSLQPFASWAVPYFNLLHRFFKAIPKSDTSFFKDFMEQEHFTFLLNAFSHLPKDAFSVGCDILALFLTHVPLARSPLVVLSITTLPSTLYRHCLMEKQASFSLSHLVKDEGYMNALFVVSDLMYRSISTLPDVDFLSQTHLLPLPDLVQFVSHLKSLVFNILFQSWNAHEHVLKTLVALLQQIHSKRSFLTLCASSDYWLTTEINADVFLAQALTEMPPSRDPSSFISPSQRVLLEIPFVVPFQHRVRLFRHYIAMDRTRFRSSHSLFSDARRFEIRRDHLFEDSFQHFHKMGNNDLKNKITILFVNEFGVPEEGIDGGGVFKEFLNEFVSFFPFNRLRFIYLFFHLFLFFFSLFKKNGAKTVSSKMLS
ncbi:hypothetical protein HMI56_002738 [Coelomomyces lativittatus]|nr:hypothetical protein HMI56_002738 [Coelomomyces lativittatus]